MKMSGMGELPNAPGIGGDGGSVEGCPLAYQGATRIEKMYAFLKKRVRLFVGAVYKYYLGSDYS